MLSRRFGTAAVSLTLAISLGVGGCGLSDQQGDSKTGTPPEAPGETAYENPENQPRTSPSRGVLSGSAEVQNPDSIVAPSPSDIRVPSRTPGLATVVDRVPTKDKVVFMTIDDGGIEEPETARLLKRRGIPVTSFLAENLVEDDPEFYGAISDLDGQVIQNHTVSHPQMPLLSESGQQAEICQSSRTLKKWFGTKPWLMRPPYGESNEATRRAAHKCGIDYIVLWRVNMPEGGRGKMQHYDGGGFRRGDIILAHYRPDLHKDIAVALRNIRKQGFRVAALQDYLPRTRG